MGRVLTASRPVRWAATGLVALTFIRLLVAYAVPLTPDETYYWIWSRALAPGYLDHPPMVALWIRAGTALAGTDAIGVRLLGPFAAALGSWLLYDTAERLFPGRSAGLAAVGLLNATLLIGVGVVIMTPDTPLLLFWTATLWAGARIACGGSPAWWLAAGGFTGLALASKYTAAFLPIGLALFAFIAVSRWWRRPEPWLGGLIAGLLFLPVVIWNARHDWAGFLHQGSRITDWRPERAGIFLTELLAGQIGLATPGIFLLLAAGLAMAVRMTRQSRHPAWSLLAAMTVPAALVFLQHAVGDRVQGNWPAILFPAASVAAAGLSAPVWRRWIWPSAGLGFAISGVLYAHVIAGWPPFPNAVDPIPRLLSGWDDLATRVEAARLAAGADFIAAEPYGLASELAWTLPPGVKVIGVNSHWGPTDLSLTDTAEAPGLLIRPERYGNEPSYVDWREVTRLVGISRTDESGEIERYALYLVRGIGTSVTLVKLPRR